MTTSDSLTLDLPAESDFFNKRRRHSTSREHNLRFGSEASTLTEILDIGNAPHVIDLLSVDVEGAELSVLSGIDFSKYRFKYILIETRASTKIIDFMTANSYHYIKHLSNHDLLFSYRIHD